ncbi:CfrBI family restriction endonuclease [Candidatus Palauibacter sp.]|uniref:CfrBI family restriction endonuclease n=1 Tax=Candidatus Palauibacter sp. TaxID=3101350 RepID=UPI003CC572B1
MNQPAWIDPFSPGGLRAATAKILTGTNYRLFFEDVTRRRLIDAYVELAEIARRHPTDDDSWRSEVKALIRDGSGQAPLRYWLIGLARKTAQNMGLRVADYPVVFDQMVDEIREMPANLAMRETVLLMWAGAATLTIRGSQKARIGKALEKAIARAALTIIGLSEAEEAFRLNIRADREVERETDAEVKGAHLGKDLNINSVRWTLHHGVQEGRYEKRKDGRINRYKLNLKAKATGQKK